MIGAAQAAAEVADEALSFIGRIVDLDAGRVESRPEPVRLRDLLAPVLAAVTPRLRKAGATLETDCRRCSRTCTWTLSTGARRCRCF